VRLAEISQQAIWVTVNFLAALYPQKRVKLFSRSSGSVSLYYYIGVGDGIPLWHQTLNKSQTSITLKSSIEDGILPTSPRSKKIESYLLCINPTATMKETPVLVWK
jgi:hypothetical protein